MYKNKNLSGAKSYTNPSLSTSPNKKPPEKEESVINKVLHNCNEGRFEQPYRESTDNYTTIIKKDPITGLFFAPNYNPAFASLQASIKHLGESKLDASAIRDLEGIVFDKDYVHTDNNFTDSHKTKLEGIDANLETRVNNKISEVTEELHSLEANVNDNKYNIEELEDTASALSNKVNTQGNTIEALTNSINTLVNITNSTHSIATILRGQDENKSARAIASEEVAKIVAGADTSFDTLKEIADWISKHPESVAALNTKIESNTANINQNIVKLDELTQDYTGFKDLVVLLNEPQTISGKKLFADNVSPYKTSGRYWTLGESNNPWDKAYITYLHAPWSGSTFGPQYDNSYDLGTNSRLWRNVYVKGALHDGTNGITVADIASKDEVPTKTSELENDAGYISKSIIPNELNSKFTVSSSLNDLTANMSYTAIQSADSGRIRSITFGNGKFWCSNTNGIIQYTSVDSLNWYSIPKFTSNTITSITFGKGMFACIDYINTGGGNVYRSYDGENWEIATTFSEGLEKILYVNGRFTIVGTSGLVAFSDDLVTFTKATTNQTASFISITYGQNKYVAVSSSGVLIYSLDGINWNDCSISGDTTHYRVAAYGRGTFVIGGAKGVIRYSYDGLTWYTATSNSTASLSYVRDLIYYNGKFFAALQHGELWTSVDGATWEVTESNSYNKWALCGAHNSVVNKDFVYLGGETGNTTLYDLAIEWLDYEPVIKANQILWQKQYLTLSDGSTVESEVEVHTNMKNINDEVLYGVLGEAEEMVVGLNLKGKKIKFNTNITPVYPGEYDENGNNKVILFKPNSSGLGLVLSIYENVTSLDIYQFYGSPAYPTVSLFTTSDGWYKSEYSFDANTDNIVSEFNSDYTTLYSILIEKESITSQVNRLRTEVDNYGYTFESYNSRFDSIEQNTLQFEKTGQQTYTTSFFDGIHQFIRNEIILLSSNNKSACFWKYKAYYRQSYYNVLIFGAYTNREYGESNFLNSENEFLVICSYRMFRYKYLDFDSYETTELLTENGSSPTISSINAKFAISDNSETLPSEVEWLDKEPILQANEVLWEKQIVTMSDGNYIESEPEVHTNMKNIYDATLNGNIDVNKKIDVGSPLAGLTIRFEDWKDYSNFLFDKDLQNNGIEVLIEPDTSGVVGLYTYYFVDDLGNDVYQINTHMQYGTGPLWTEETLYDSRAGWSKTTFQWPKETQGNIYKMIDNHTEYFSANYEVISLKETVIETYDLANSNLNKLNDLEQTVSNSVFPFSGSKVIENHDVGDPYLGIKEVLLNLMKSYDYANKFYKISKNIRGDKSYGFIVSSGALRNAQYPEYFSIIGNGDILKAYPIKDGNDNVVDFEIKSLVPTKQESSIIDVESIPVGWKGTPVPTSGYVEKVYFNTNLSSDEVKSIIDSLEPNIVEEDNGTVYRKYKLFMGVDDYTDVGIVINDYSIFACGGDKEIYYNEEWSSAYLDVVQEVHTDGFIINQNDKLSSLISITPFEKVEINKNAIYRCKGKLYLWNNNKFEQLVTKEEPKIIVVGSEDYPLEYSPDSERCECNVDLSQNGKYLIDISNITYSRDVIQLHLGYMKGTNVGKLMNTTMGSPMGAYSVGYIGEESIIDYEPMDEYESPYLYIEVEDYHFRIYNGGQSI